MIVDAHAHLVVREWYPDSYWQGLARIYSAVLTRMGNPIPPEAVDAMFFPQLFDPTGEKTLAVMDEAGIEVKVLLPLDLGLGLGEPPVDYLTQNRQILSIASQHPDRFIGYFGVDPRREGAVEALDRAVNDWGARGLKLHPTTGYYPDDEVVYPLLEKANELGIPVLCHTGPIFGPLKSKYARPLHLDTVAADFPDLTIIAAHLSFQWWPELAGIGSNKTNLMCDFSGWQLTASGHPDEFRRALRGILDAFGAERVMFGTDDPYYHPAFPEGRWAGLVKSLADGEVDGISFSQGEIELIMGGTARKLYGLQRPAGLPD